MECFSLSIGHNQREALNFTVFSSSAIQELSLAVTMVTARLEFQCWLSPRPGPALFWERPVSLNWWVADSVWVISVLADPDLTSLLKFLICVWRLDFVFLFDPARHPNGFLTWVCSDVRDLPCCATGAVTGQCLAQGYFRMQAHLRFVFVCLNHSGEVLLCCNFVFGSFRFILPRYKQTWACKQKSCGLTSSLLIGQRCGHRDFSGRDFTFSGVCDS